MREAFFQKLHTNLDLDQRFSKYEAAAPWGAPSPFSGGSVNGSGKKILHWLLLLLVIKGRPHRID